MKIFLSVIIAILVLIAFIGCGKKTERTTPIKVENPTERTTKVTAPKPEKPAAPKPEAEKKPTPDKKGFITTESGLKYKDIKVGKGAEAKSGDTVQVHYKGWLDDGTVFDTSKKAGRGPFSFTIDGGQVIKGWDEGVQGMKVGGVRELIIPADLGYGNQDMGTIPPNSTLHFEVELLKVGS